MDLAQSPADRAFRADLRAWLTEHAPPPMPRAVGPDLRARDLAWQRSLHEAGYAGINWPVEFGGRGLSLARQMIWFEETARAGISHVNSLFVGVSHAGPTIITCGTEAQKARWLPPILRGEAIWCQGFSEPEAGSDLASLQTRAVRDGDDLVVNGVKIWTSFAQVADHQEMLVRTDPDAPKHRGITWLVCDMDQPGIEIRPIRTLVRESHFCEVHYHDVRVPIENVVGEIDDGWRVARATLAYEHGVANLGQQIRLARTVERVAEAAEARDCDAATWARIADARADVASLRAMTALMISRIARQDLPGPEGSLVKLRYGEVSQLVHTLGVDVLGSDGLEFVPDDDTLVHGYLASLAATIGGGTSEIQRDIVAERLLGLPR
ncbi:MAG: acyl-CoA dehydrogenase [Actinobacteria bacterium]|nr:acyl-CoA dehydrogenase [Actinomycetota bacterium]